MTRVVAVIQARMASTRLPGKVLEALGRSTLLGQVIRRVRLAQGVSEVLIATSDQPADDPIVDYCATQDLPCVRGSESDVLARFVLAAQASEAEAIIRITADCPLIDPAVIERVLAVYLDSASEHRDRPYDYVSNILRYTYPDGLDVEVFSRSALETAAERAHSPHEREHVTPYLRLAPEFVRANVDNPVPLPRPVDAYRFTVDTPADLAFVRRLYQALEAPGTEPPFGLNAVLAWLEANPEYFAQQGDSLMNEGYYLSLYQQAQAGSAPRRDVSRSLDYFKRAAKVIPGSAQTFSKGANQHVHGIAPVFLARGEGCRVWDLDGNEYIDYIQGLLPNILGYAHPEVNAAASRQLDQGHSFSLPHPLEVELAERLIEIIPCAEQVRFMRNGSDATSAAVRVARAATGREHIASCGYHGWHDWYIGSTTRHKGVPEAVRALTHPFAYNDLASLEALFTAWPDQIAAVIMEPVNFVMPAPGFLESVQALARKHGAVLVFDEICTGFHLGLGGAQKRYGVTPDLACFGKALGNGFPISCLVGRADLMGIFEDIFVSFTFAGEVSAMAASMKVLDILEHSEALARMEAFGRQLQDGFNIFAREAGLSTELSCVGHPSWSLMRFRDAQGVDSFLVRSLFQQEASKRGLLTLTTHNMSAAHDEQAIQQTLEAYAAIFKTLSEWLKDADPARFLEGRAVEPVFRVR